jgi:hypothetical protein
MSETLNASAAIPPKGKTKLPLSGIIFAGVAIVATLVALVALVVNLVFGSAGVAFTDYQTTDYYEIEGDQVLSVYAVVGEREITHYSTGSIVYPESESNNAQHSGPMQVIDLLAHDTTSEDMFAYASKLEQQGFMLLNRANNDVPSTSGYILASVSPSDPDKVIVLTIDAKPDGYCITLYSLNDTLEHVRTIPVW